MPLVAKTSNIVKEIKSKRMSVKNPRHGFKGNPVGISRSLRWYGFVEDIKFQAYSATQVMGDKSESDICSPFSKI